MRSGAVLHRRVRGFSESKLISAACGSGAYAHVRSESVPHGKSFVRFIWFKHLLSDRYWWVRCTRNGWVSEGYTEELT